VHGNNCLIAPNPKRNVWEIVLLEEAGKPTLHQELIEEGWLPQAHALAQHGGYVGRTHSGEGCIAGMEEAVELSICIVTHNRWSDVNAALAAVFLHTADLSREVIVVDNGCTDHTHNLIESIYPVVILLSTGRNLGYAPAMNLALARSRGRYVLMLSHDAELNADSAQALIRFMDTHTEAGLAGPRTLDATGNITTTLHSPNLWLSLWGEIVPLKKWLRGSRHLRGLATMVAPIASGLTADYTESHQAPIIDGGCIIVRRQVLQVVGLLDPYIPQGPDDYDWCFRARAHGFEVWFVAESQVLHRSSPKEEFASLSAIYIRMRWPQVCYLYGKYHQGFGVKLFCLSAALLIWKWRYQAWRLYGARSEYDDMLKDSLGLCLSLRKYRNMIAESQVPGAPSATSIRQC
jgi:GT2 family glycosyltransferase